MLSLLFFSFLCVKGEKIYNINHSSNVVSLESCLEYEDQYCIMPNTGISVLFDANYFTYHSKNQQTSAKLFLSNNTIALNIYINSYGEIFYQDSVFYRILPHGKYYTCSMNNGCCLGNPCTTDNSVTYEWNVYNMTLSVFGPLEQIGGSNLIITYTDYADDYGGIEYFLLGMFQNEMFNIMIQNE
jgi:hypothetical protein